MYSATHFSLALDGVGGKRPTLSSVLPRDKPPVPIVKVDMWASGSAWMGVQKRKTFGRQRGSIPGRSCP
jgi:hypothetical protein